MYKNTIFLITGIALLCITGMANAAMVKTTISGNIDEISAQPTDGTFFLAVGDAVEVSFVYDNEARAADFYDRDTGEWVSQRTIPNNALGSFLSNAEVTVSGNITRQVEALQPYAAPLDLSWLTLTPGQAKHVLYPHYSSFQGLELSCDFNNWASLEFNEPGATDAWETSLRIHLYTSNSALNHGYNYTEITLTDSLLYQTTPVPIPGTIFLLGPGLLCLARIRRKLP